MSDEIVERLDQLIGMFALVNRAALSQAAAEVRGDKVNAAILDAAQELVAAGELVKKVAKEQSVSERTVQNRLSELVTMKALNRVGSGRSIQYSATGLV